jgi:predicted histone-like DNA-binding protein
MAVFYNKVQRKNPSDPNATPKWYPALRTTGMLKEKEVARQIADETTLNPKEAEMALSQLHKIMLRALHNGQSIQLGDWGSFHLTLNAEGSETEADVSATKVRKVNIRFSPGKELKESVAKVEFRQASTLSK